jgi:hypothetical protein
LGFRSLQHLRNRRSTFRGFASPASFRLQGLATLLTACSLRFRAGFFSHRQRSWDSPFGGFPSRKVSDASPHRIDPPAVHPVILPDAVASDRPDGPRFLGLVPSESPLCPRGVLTRRPPVPPLGLTLLGFRGKHLGRAFTRPPLTRFTDPTTSARARRRPRVSIGPRLDLPVHRT